MEEGDTSKRGFPWKLWGDEEGGESSSNTRAPSASNGPGTEAGSNEIPHAKLEPDCRVAACLHVF